MNLMISDQMHDTAGQMHAFASNKSKSPYFHKLSCNFWVKQQMSLLFLKASLFQITPLKSSDVTCLFMLTNILSINLLKCLRKALTYLPVYNVEIQRLKAAYDAA